MAERSSITSTLGNTLLAGGGASLIYVRSRRSTVTLGLAGVVWTLAFAALAFGASRMPDGAIAAMALAVGAAGGAAFAAWSFLRLAAWPPGKLALFRDRLLVIQGNHEMRGIWSNMEAVTLAEPNAWPDVRVTDRLTIRLKNELPLVLRPALFGLQPAACRDLIVRLRDDPKLRTRLPEFDSLRDLAITPVVAGELIEPRL
jgi:hypothetical protein